MIKQEILCVLTLLFFALSNSAQKMPDKRIAGAGFVTGPSRALQSDSLIRLTAEEVQMIIQAEAKGNPRALTSLAQDPEQRKSVLENLRQALAVANEARKNGFAAEQSVKMQLKLAEAEVLATAYDDKLKADAGRANDPVPPFNYIDDKKVDAFFNDPANKTEYARGLEKFLSFLTDTQKKVTPQEMTDEQKQFAASQWKKVTYGMVKAKELRLVNRKIELQYKLQQALILARAYSQEKLEDRLTPTADEIKAYMAANPKFSKESRRARAAEILAKVKAGGNFAALADEYSEDPGNKDAQTGKPQGGLYDWRNRAYYVKEFSDASWALEEGQTSGIVETQFGYHILKLEGKRAVKGEEQVKVRHILISTMYQPEPGLASNRPSVRSVDEAPLSMPMSMPMSMEEAAKQELAKQKEKQVMDEILARNPIDLPPDFAVSAGRDPAAKPAKSVAAAKPAKPAKPVGAAKTRKKTGSNKRRTSRIKH